MDLGGRSEAGDSWSSSSSVLFFNMDLMGSSLDSTSSKLDCFLRMDEMALKLNPSKLSGLWLQLVPALLYFLFKMPWGSGEDLESEIDYIKIKPHAELSDQPCVIFTVLGARSTLEDGLNFRR